METSIKQLRFTSPAERKQFEIGKQIVAAKIGKSHVPTFKEKQDAEIKAGRLQVLKKLGRVGFKKCFGCEPPTVRTLATSTPAKATVAKSPAPTAPASPPAGRRELIRHFSVARGLF